MCQITSTCIFLLLHNEKIFLNKNSKEVYQSAFHLLFELDQIIQISRKKQG